MRSRLPAVFLAALLPATSFAVPVTYEFTGQITGAGGRSPPEGQEFVPILPFGTEFTASFTYDDAALPGYEGEGWRIYTDPVTAASVSFGSGGSLGIYHLGAPMNGGESSRVALLNDMSFDGTTLFDELDIVAMLGNQPGDSAWLQRWMSFGTWDPTALQLNGEETLADPLPLGPDPSVFHQFTFGYSLWDETGRPIDQATVSSQEVLVRRVTSVPEPGTWSMFLSGLAGIWLVSRRRAPLAR